MPTQLKWKYCECGCHGSFIHIGPLYYWSILDLRASIIRLCTEHAGSGERVTLGVFTTNTGMDAEVRRHASVKLKELQRDINRARAILKESE